MNGLLAILFNGLLLFPSNTDAVHNNNTSNEVMVNQYSNISSILSLCNINYADLSSFDLSFSVDENKQVHINSITATGTELDSMMLVKLEHLLQSQVGCLPIDQPISISLKLNDQEKKIS